MQIKGNPKKSRVWLRDQPPRSTAETRESAPSPSVGRTQRLPATSHPRRNLQQHGNSGQRGKREPIRGNDSSWARSIRGAAGNESLSAWTRAQDALTKGQTHGPG